MDLGKVMDTILYNSLSPPGINQKIKANLRTLHAIYGGLGLCEINANCLSLNIHLMRVNWTSNSALGQITKQAFETCVTNLSFAEHVFTINCKKYHKMV